MLGRDRAGVIRIVVVFEVDDDDLVGGGGQVGGLRVGGRRQFGAGQLLVDASRVELVVDHVIVEEVVVVGGGNDHADLLRGGSAEDVQSGDIEVSGVVEDAVFGAVFRLLVIAIGRHCGISKRGVGCHHPFTGYCEGRMTTKRSPASTCWLPVIASRSMTPSTVAVMAASIFIASIDATG